MIRGKDVDWGMDYVIAENAKDVLVVIKEMRDKIKAGSVVALDFETEKLAGDSDDNANPLQDSMFSISFAPDEDSVYTFRLQNDGKWLYPDAIVNEIISFFEMLMSTDIKKIVHNLKFDVKLVSRLVGRIPDVNDMSWEDTMILCYVMDENRTCKLKSAAGRFLNIDAGKFEEQINAHGKIKNVGNIDWLITAKYNCADSWMTRKLYFRLIALAEEEGVLDLYEKLYKGLSLVLLETEVHGFKVNMDYLKATLLEIEKSLADKLKDLSEFYKRCRQERKDKIEKSLLLDHAIDIVTVKLKKTLEGVSEAAQSIWMELVQISADEKKEFNPRSPMQLLLAIQYLKLDVALQGAVDKRILKKTDKGRLPLDKDALAYLSDIDKSGFIKILLEFRKEEKTRGTITGLIERSDKENVIRTSYLQHGTTSGRLSSRDPNLQNLTRGPLIRSAFIPRDETDLVIADFSQIELRLAAFYSQDESMSAIYAADRDIHSRTAIVCYSLPCTEDKVKELFPDERTKAKIINFGILYGMSDWTLADTLGCERDDATRYISNYYGEFPGLLAYKREVEELVYREEVVMNVFGRRRRFPGLHDAIDKHGTQDGEIAHQLREAFNAIIQGTAADICNLTIVKVRRELLARGIYAPLLAQVHDEMVWEPRKEHSQEVKKVIEEIAPSIIEGCFTPIEVKVCKTWAEK